MSSGGFIKLFRKIQSCDWYKDKPFDKAHAWLDLLLAAAWEPCIEAHNGQPIALDRGQLAVSSRELAVKWGWSRNKLARYLAEIKVFEQIILDTKNNITIITISNYEKYQDNFTKPATEPETKPLAEPPTEPAKKDVTSSKKIDCNDEELNNGASNETTGGAGNGAGDGASQKGGNIRGDILKEERINEIKNIESAFEEFWNLYDVKEDKKTCREFYLKLSASDREKIKIALPAYLNRTTTNRVNSNGLKYRKNPLTWLRRHCWNDEGSIPQNPMNNKTGTLQRDFVPAANERGTR